MESVNVISMNTVSYMAQISISKGDILVTCGTHNYTIQKAYVVELKWYSKKNAKIQLFLLADETS